MVRNGTNTMSYICADCGVDTTPPRDGIPLANVQDGQIIVGDVSDKNLVLRRRRSMSTRRAMMIPTNRATMLPKVILSRRPAIAMTEMA
jgi:hypothetical protein